MRPLKTHSHTSERPGYEARKNAKKVIEGNADTIIRLPPSKNLPRTASVARGARQRRRYEKVNDRQKPPANSQRGEGGETKKGELKENARAMTRETNVKTLRRPPSWRGARCNILDARKSSIPVPAVTRIEFMAPGTPGMISHTRLPFSIKTLYVRVAATCFLTACLSACLSARLSVCLLMMLIMPCCATYCCDSPRRKLRLQAWTTA